MYNNKNILQIQNTNYKILYFFTDHLILSKICKTE